jgi:hypothetical protein
MPSTRRRAAGQLSSTLQPQDPRAPMTSRAQTADCPFRQQQLHQQRPPIKAPTRRTCMPHSHPPTAGHFNTKPPPPTQVQGPTNPRRATTSHAGQRVRSSGQAVPGGQHCVSATTFRDERLHLKTAPAQCSAMQLHNRNALHATHGGRPGHAKTEYPLSEKCETSVMECDLVISPKAWSAEQVSLPVQELFDWHMKVPSLAHACPLQSLRLPGM